MFSRYMPIMTPVIASTALALTPFAAANAQLAAPDKQPKSCVHPGFFAGPSTYKSVDVATDGHVTFRLCAPDAHEVRVTSTDIADVIPMGFPPGTPIGLAMTRDDSGLWSVTTAKPVPPDTYRFAFRVDGVKVPDPEGTTWSQERVGIDSTFEVHGATGAFQSYHKTVPHGVVSVVDYWSKSLHMKRRAHVYTPPGYMAGTKRYPVLYLVHGAGDSDDSWTSVGHTNYILDNLIAAGKARPMIIVMPFGHTPVRLGENMLDNNDFGNDFINDLIPYVDAHFRTIATPDERAMAGLSMGGAHTIRYGLTHPELFHYIGIFSMGLALDGAGMGGKMDQVTPYEQAHAGALKRDAKALKLLYYAIGNHDFLYATSAPTRGMFDKYRIPYVYHESDGGHTWINWRRYLADFAPRLFR